MTKNKKLPQGKRTNLNGYLGPLVKPEVKFLTPYYYQDGAWHRLYEIEFKEGKKRGKRKPV